MRVIVIMSVYNEVRNIEKGIRSVIDQVDQIHVWDGAFKPYPHDKPWSTDGTIELVKKLAKENDKIVLHECKETWEGQIEKRTAMFSNGKAGDYFVVLDGDEYITNPEDIRLIIQTQDLDVGWAWTISNLYQDPVRIARIIKWQEGLHFAGRHHWLFDGKNDLITSHQNMNPAYNHVDTDLRFFNFREKASFGNEQSKREFLVKRNEGEFKYRSELGVYNRVHPLIPRPMRAGKTTLNTLDVLRVVGSCKYTMSLMVSRLWAIYPFFERLATVKLPESLEIVVVVDHDNKDVYERVKDYLVKDKRFDGVKIIWTHKEPPEEFTNVNERRQRIVNNWGYILSEARGEILLGSEDDSLPEPRAYTKLLNIYNSEKPDFIQGNIIGRWGAKLCPAWKVITINGKPTVVYNAKEQRSGLEEIQGVGWYCFVTSVDLMRKYPMYLDDEMPLGGDLRQGWELVKHGHKILHCWDVKVEHFTETYSLIIGQEPTEQRVMVKEKGKWKVLE